MGKKTDSKQIEFKAKTSWFHFYSDLIDSNELAEMNSECSATSAVLLVLKRYIHEQKFVDWGKVDIPSIATLSEKSGFSRNTTKKALEVLEKRNFIKQTNKSTTATAGRGRKKKYEYYDRILIKADDDSSVAGELMIPYEPKIVASVQHAIKTMMEGMSQGIEPDFSNPLFQVVMKKEYKNYFVQNIESGGTGTMSNVGTIDTSSGSEEIKKEIENISYLMSIGELPLTQGMGQIQQLQLTQKKMDQE